MYVFSTERRRWGAKVRSGTRSNEAEDSQTQGVLCDRTTRAEGLHVGGELQVKVQAGHSRGIRHGH